MNNALPGHYVLTKIRFSLHCLRATVALMRYYLIAQSFTISPAANLVQIFHK